MSKWTYDIDQRRINLIREGCTYREIAEILTREYGIYFTPKSVENRGRKTNTTKSLINDDHVFGTIHRFNHQENDTHSRQDRLFPNEVYVPNEDVMFTPEKKRFLRKVWEELNNGKPKKILSLSDLHAPFINFEAVERAIIDHDDADIVVLNGDVFDGNALSDYDKLRDFDIEIEFKQVFILLDVITRMFDRVYWVGGNHDLLRFVRMVSRKFGTAMKNYVFKRLNPIDYIAEKYNNVIVVPHQFVQIGECVFNHPDGYSSALMSTAINQERNIRANMHDLLPYPKFSCLVQGHTHDLGEYYVNGCKVIEQGCLTYIHDYRFDKPSQRRWVLGYAVVHLNGDGSVNFNETRNYLIEVK